MSNYYAQAIQVLADSKIDFRALVYEVAKANPKAVVKAADRLDLGFGWLDSWATAQGYCLVEIIFKNRG